jgi:hypothetical protein
MRGLLLITWHASSFKPLDRYPRNLVWSIYSEYYKVTVNSLHYTRNWNQNFETVYTLLCEIKHINVWGGSAAEHWTVFKETCLNRNRFSELWLSTVLSRGATTGRSKPNIDRNFGVTCHLLHPYFLLALFANPEDGGNMFHRNVGWLQRTTRCCIAQDRAEPFTTCRHL